MAPADNRLGASPSTRRRRADQLIRFMRGDGTVTDHRAYFDDINWLHAKGLIEPGDSGGLPRITDEGRAVASRVIANDNRHRGGS